MKKTIILVLYLCFLSFAGKPYFYFSGLKMNPGDVFSETSNEIEISVSYPNDSLNNEYFLELKIKNNSSESIILPQSGLLLKIGNTNQVCGVVDHKREISAINSTLFGYSSMAKMSGQKTSNQNLIDRIIEMRPPYEFKTINQGETVSGFFVFETNKFKRKLIKKAYKEGKNVTSGTIKLIFNSNGEEIIKEIIVPLAYDQPNGGYYAGHQQSGF